jgi:peptide/nickel transport system substrate-binding protein
MTISRYVVALALATTLASPAAAEKVFRQANDLSLGGAENLDPLSSNTWITPVALIYSRLMREGENGEASPELATSWTANAEATEWTLTLQPGVTFHDGSTFDAADVAYSLSRIEDPALESPVAAVLGIIDRVEVIDPMTVKIILEAPHAGLPARARSASGPLTRKVRRPSWPMMAIGKVGRCSTRCSSPLSPMPKRAIRR